MSYEHPLPIESTDPELAAMLKLISERKTNIKHICLTSKQKFILIDDEQITKSITIKSTNVYGPCPCGSGKKYKFCCKQSK